MTSTARNSFDRDPKGTYRKIMASIDEDVRNGYLNTGEERRLRSAAGRLYIRGKKIKNKAEENSRANNE